MSVIEARVQFHLPGTVLQEGGDSAKFTWIASEGYFGQLLRGIVIVGICGSEYFHNFQRRQDIRIAEQGNRPYLVTANSKA